MAVIASVYAHLCNVQKPPIFLRKTLLSQVVIFRNVHFKHLLYIGGVYDFFSLVFQDKTNMACFRRVLMCYNPVACYYAVFIQGVCQRLAGLTMHQPRSVGTVCGSLLLPAITSFGLIAFGQLDPISNSKKIGMVSKAAP